MNMRPQPFFRTREPAAPRSPRTLRSSLVALLRTRCLVAALPVLASSAALAVAGCSGTTPPSTSPAQPDPSQGYKAPGETHFSELVQLTDGGENAEAYWSSAGDRLIFQAHSGEGCDQIYTMSVDQPLPEPHLVSTGKGATTCAYFMPGDQQIIYSSTHLGGEACPPKPDHGKGYVWPLYSSY